MPPATLVHLRYSNARLSISFNVHGVIYVGDEATGALIYPFACSLRLIHDAEVVAPIEREIRTLAHGLTSVKDEQEYIVIRERTHRNTAESTNARVKWWSISQTVVLFSVVAWQVYYLKVIHYAPLTTPSILTRLCSPSSRSRGSFKVIVIVVSATCYTYFTIYSEKLECASFHLLL